MIVCTETVLIGRKCDPMEERIKQQYDRWLSQPGMPADLADELNSIAGDEDAITDRFYRELEFGTGGLRGVIGTGTNRMNVYNIRKATQGLANYLNASDLPKKVAIGYDSRIKSDVFAKETAAVLAANGIKAYIYPRLEPTPALSWAVRYYGCGAGVCVTASHNPAKYNGYKVYGADGCQITLEVAAKILAAIEAVDCFAVQPADFDAALAEGKIEYSSEKCLDDFVDAVYAQRVGDGAGTADASTAAPSANGAAADNSSEGNGRGDSRASAGSANAANGSSSGSSAGAGDDRNSGGSADAPSASSPSSSSGALGSSDASPSPAPASIAVSVVVDSSAAASLGFPATMASATLKLPEGATADDALAATGLSLEGSSSYVSAVNGLAEKMMGGTSGWTYTVNGTMPMTAASNYILHEGDAVRWVYVS